MEVGELINCIATTFWVILGLTIGTRILLKVRNEKLEYKMVGVAMILITSPWWGVVVKFLIYSISGFLISDAWYLLIANVSLPALTVGWAYTLSRFLEISRTKLIVAIFAGLYSIFLVVLIVALSTGNDGFIGIVNGFDSSFSDFSKIFAYLTIMTLFVSGTIFSVRSAKSIYSEVKLKGIILQFAWTLILMGAIMDSLQTIGLVLFLARIFLVLSSIFYYIGWFLPKPIKKIFIKEKNDQEELKASQIKIQ